MLVSRNIEQSPFTEVDVGALASFGALKAVTPSFVDIDGQKNLLLYGQREIQFFNPDVIPFSVFSGGIKTYTQIEEGKFIETDTDDSPWQNIATGARGIDLVVADFNKDGTPEIVSSFDRAEAAGQLFGNGVVRYYQPDDNGIYQEVSDPFAEINLEDGSKFFTTLDANGDGFLDLVINIGTEDGFTIYTYNGETFELFTGETNLPAEIDLNETNSIYSVDGDNDGDLDVVVEDGGLSFFRYQDGQYTEVAEADNPFAGVDEVSGLLAFTDIDSDTDIDVFGLEFASGDVNFYENVSIENNNPPIAADDSLEVLSFGSQELDVLFNDYGRQNQTLTINSFDETSALGGTITIEDNKLFYTAPTGITTVTEDTFSYTVTNAEGQTDTATVTLSVFPQLFLQRKADENPFAYLDVGGNATPDLADIDGDGDLDLISGNANAEIRYFRNDEGVFNEQIGIENPFTEADLEDSFGDNSAVAFADYDLDGDLDFVGASDRVRNNGEYFYFENNNGVYTELFGTENPVRDIDTINADLKPVAIDWDDDGDEDLVVGSGSSIKYFQNDNGILQEVSEADNPFRAFNAAEEDSELEIGFNVSVNFFDFDRDEDLDIIAGNSFGNVFAFRNDNNDWTKLTGRNNPLGNDIDLEDDAAIGRGDVDDDGDDDVIIGKSNGTFLYWENLAVFNGNPPSIEQTPDVPDFYPQSFNRQEAENPFSSLSAGIELAPELADIDGDGDLDLIVGNDNAEIRYFRNDESNFNEQTGTNNPFAGIDIGGSFIDDSAVAFADYDGDGDLDFVGTSERVQEEGEYFYFRNDGGSYTQLSGDDNPIQYIISLEPVLKPTAIDWDGDGDEDLFVGTDSFVRYFENDNGILQEVAERENPLRFFNLVEDDSDAPLYLGSDISVEFFDFDDDGDLDLLTGNISGDVLAFQNDDNGWTPLTGENHPFGEDIEIDFVGKIAKGDIDNDGNEDFIVGSEDNFLSWENQPIVANTSINRFQNTNVPGTYLFAGETESENIRENFPNFAEEGLAFKVAVEPGDDLIPLYRFQSNVVPGTYLFAGESERENINENFSENFTEEGIAFYVYGVGADRGATFYRFQNSDRPGTYLFAGESERENIIANFPNFIEEGTAFEVGV